MGEDQRTEKSEHGLVVVTRVFDRVHTPSYRGSPEGSLPRHIRVQRMPVPSGSLVHRVVPPWVLAGATGLALAAAVAAVLGAAWLMSDLPQSWNQPARAGAMLLCIMLLVVGLSALFSSLPALWLRRERADVLADDLRNEVSFLLHAGNIAAERRVDDPTWDGKAKRGALRRAYVAPGPMMTYRIRVELEDGSEHTLLGGLPSTEEAKVVVDVVTDWLSDDSRAGAGETEDTADAPDDGTEAER